MTVPYTFANATGNIPLAQLDANFANVGGYANTAGTVTTNAQPNITTVGTLSYVSTTGNVTGAYFVGNGSQLTGIIATSTYGNANVAAYLPTYTGTLSGGNIAVTGRVQALGNVSGNYILGNGSQLTGISANYSNANVADYLPTYSGNVSGNFFIGDGSQLTNLPVGNYSNANVANYLPTFSGNVNANNISVTTEIGANVINATGEITSFANIVVSPGGYFIGDGSLLSNVSAGNYGNANVEAYLPSSNTIIAINSNVANLSNSLSNTNSNITTLQGQVYTDSNVITLLSNYSNSISTTGNVTGNFFVGDGSLLTNLPSGNSNIILNGNSNVEITTANGNVAITAAGTYEWVFDTTGNLTAALNIIANGSSPAPVLQNFTFDSFNGIISSLGTSFDIGAKQSPTTGAGYNLALSAGSGLGNIGGNVNITAGFGANSIGNGNITLNSGPNTWNFDNTGNLILPANTFAVNYANGTPVSISGGSTPNAIINGNSSVEFAGAGANIEMTVGGTGIADISSNTFGVTGDLSVTGNIYGNIFGNILTTPAYGSFYDTTTQINSNVGNGIPMTFNTTDINNQITIAAGNTQITIGKTGVYNIQFSAQINKTSGGADNIYVWLDKNGNAVSNSATAVYLVGNNSKIPAAWNFVVSATAGDYYRLMWEAASADIELLAEAPAGDVPAIPSVILTVVPVGA